ncbi:uncharacterized protein LOC133203547 [Saccostrea echinata]|uniref:uncharacterized protein LOC133203547 n=1 Tax=Saccostrea echinata TaxID=191078 RepID=UPI002A8219E7|nr:uncharacterized protein LOC133203547 [Saccostrea echinata]
MQLKTKRLAKEAAKIGLQVNIDKTEVMRLQNKQQTPITLGEHKLKDVDSFTYLGSIVTITGGTDEDIKARIKARHVFITLKPVWKSTALSTPIKLRIYNTNVKSVLLYGSETWRVTNTTSNKLQTFANRCLRHILNIRWPENINNKNLWETTNQDPITKQITRRKWRWIGHTLRKPSGDITRHALEWNPQGKWRVGRPRTTWRRSCEEEIRQCGHSWEQLKKAAQNRVRWRTVAEALCSTRNQKEP